MALAEWFWKRYNSGVTKKLGRAPLRKRFSKYRQARAKRKHSFLGAKKLQDVKGIKPDTKFRLMGIKQ